MKDTAACTLNSTLRCCIIILRKTCFKIIFSYITTRREPVPRTRGGKGSVEDNKEVSLKIHN